ncbi:MAG TPA: DHH family phosphoesterase [Thermoanaerobaculia bacterium]
MTMTLDAANVARFTEFVERLDKQSRIVAVHDSDADGVSSAVVWQRAFERLGFTNLARVIPDRYRDAWTPANRERIAAASPAALFVLDLGTRAEPLVDGVPTCLIDHHRPDGVMPGATLITAYGQEPTPNTSIMTWELCNALVDIRDLEWIAAIGAISDLGERAPFSLIAGAKLAHTAKALKQVTTLINSARRASHYDPEVAARILLAHDSPQELLMSRSDDLRHLMNARDEVNAEFARGKMAAPVFSKNVALVRVRSRCLIHPLVAQIWRSRLPKYIVIVANEDYLPGRVNFSARSIGNVSALALLSSIELPPGEGSYGHGHDHATGGSLPPERWNALLATLGFDSNSYMQITQQ